MEQPPCQSRRPSFVRDCGKVVWVQMGWGCFRPFLKKNLAKNQMIIHVGNTVCLLTNDLSHKILSGSGSTCPGPGPLDLVRVRISVKDDEPDVKRGWYMKNMKKTKLRYCAHNQK